MIKAREFVEPARARGFTWYAGVPCSYLTPFINYVSEDSSLRYLSMTNEGDAVAVIAGTTLAAEGTSAGRGVVMMQNSGLGNAVSPLTSLTWTFKLPQLLIVTWRGQPGVPDEPQHELMGGITARLLDTMGIVWEPFPTDAAAVEAALDRAIAHMDETGLPFAFIMTKGSVEAHALGGSSGIAARASSGAEVDFQFVQDAPVPLRRDVLSEVIARTPVDSTVLFASTGFCGRELYAIDDRKNQLYMVGSMGCVGSLALGFALARPDLQVIALDGDGAALMRLGSMATIGTYGPPNLRHLLLDNGVHDSTGGQFTVAPNIEFAHIALACGYASALDTNSQVAISDWLHSKAASGPRFARVVIRPGTSSDLPRPSSTPVEVKERLTGHLHSAIGVN